MCLETRGEDKYRQNIEINRSMERVDIDLIDYVGYGDYITGSIAAWAA